MPKLFASLIFLAVAAFFGAFFVVPIVSTLAVAFFDSSGSFTLANVSAVFANPLYVEGLYNSLRMAVFSTAGALLIAIPLAVLATKFSFPGKAIFASLILIPLILPPFVGAIGVKQILGTDGAFNNFLMAIGLMDDSAPFDWLGSSRLLGVVIMNALHLYPIIYLNVSASLSNLDPAMEEAADNLGCTPGRRFFKITLPLIAPGLFAGATIVFIWSFTELGGPLIFDYGRVTSVQIFDGLKDIGENPMPFALVAVMLLATALIYTLSKCLFGRDPGTSASKATIGRETKSLPLWKGLAVSATFTLVTAIAVLPHLGVILMSFSTDWYGSVLPDSFTLQHYRDALGHDLAVPSIANSLKYASLSTLLDLVLGVAIAYVVVRTTLPGRHILDALAMLPLAVPGLVMAFGFLAMSRPGQPFDFLVIGGDPILLLVIAYAVRRLPYVVRAAAAGFQQTGRVLEEAAQNLGASPFRAMLRVTLPLITANLIAGGLLAFSFAMLEVSDSLILAQQREHFPITNAIYSLSDTLGSGPYLASALGVWAMVFLAITIVGASIFLGKKLGALFRV